MSLLNFFKNTFVFFAIGVSSLAQATDLDQKKNSIDAALSGGDYFRAYRVAISIESEKPQDFEKYGLEGYLKSLFIIAPAKQIKEECGRLINVILTDYLCGLHYTEKKDVDEAFKYLEKIQKTTKFYWPAQILKATNELVRNKPENALDDLKVSEISNYKALGLQELFYLTRSRALIALGLFDDAVKFSQAVNSGTTYYVEALEQTAWIFFKTRRLESAQILLDVLISSYETPKKRESDIKVSATSYFRARYLRAYLALIEQRPEGAANEFSQLKGDFDKFYTKLKPLLGADKLVQNFSNKKGIYQMKDLPSYLELQVNYLTDWLGADVAQQYKNEIKFQVALNAELARTKFINAQEAKTYFTRLEPLKNSSFQFLQSHYVKTLERLNKNLETMSLKADLGRLDVFWLNRAEGARNLDEVIENYKQTTKSFETYMDL